MCLFTPLANVWHVPQRIFRSVFLPIADGDMGLSTC